MEGFEEADYRALDEFRRQIRRFLRFSEDKAKEHGLEAQQHQLLLTIKALPEGCKATIGEVANRLLIRHHSAVELADRLEHRGAIRRTHSDEDRREVILELTAEGDQLLARLSHAHRSELETSGPALAKSLLSVIRKQKRIRHGKGVLLEN